MSLIFQHRTIAICRFFFLMVLSILAENSGKVSINAKLKNNVSITLLQCPSVWTHLKKHLTKASKTFSHISESLAVSMNFSCCI